MRIPAAVGPERSPTLRGAAGLVLHTLGVHLRRRFSGQWSGRVMVLCGCAHRKCVCHCVCVCRRACVHVYPGQLCT